MEFLLLWIWCCWSCFLLRSPCDRLVRTSISGVRMCVHVRACARTRDTYAGIGHAGYRGHKYPLTTPKTASLRPKNGDIYIFIYFYLMVTNGHAGHQKHHPTHLLSPHKYFLYALSEQQKPSVLLAVNTRGLDFSALWIPCWVLQICCVHIGDHIGDRICDRGFVII